ncbi:MarR family winged helix-turn-helix transcriptional regulator, partial [Polaromonas sp.]|uniref:MarR family winged helix-turn-helix transcriptional regulator n=1 Tax=Polaromonas sp. TaxID=1869339 RepID=UPI002730D5A8
SSELAEHAHVHRSRTSKAVTTLAEKQLVSRSSRAGDARQIRLELTEAGRQLHARLFPLVRRINHDVLSVLTPQEVTLLADLLTRLQQSADALAAEGGLPLGDRRHGSSARRYKPAAD